MIRPDQLHNAIYLVDAHGAGDALDALTRTTRGPKSRVTGRLYLIAGTLAVMTQRDVKVKTLHHMLTVELDVDAKRELGVPLKDEGFSKHSFYKYSERLAQCTDYGYGSAPDLHWVERKRRRDGMQDVMNRLMRASLDGITLTSAASLDQSALYTWNKKAPYIVSALEEDAQPTEYPAEIIREREAKTAAKIVAAARGYRKKKRRGPTPDFDAEKAHKTKTDGDGTEWFVGYMANGLVQVAEDGSLDKVPGYVVGLSVSRATADVVQPSLDLLDNLAVLGHGITSLIVDRHYSYKDVARWARELQKRGIVQHLDMHPLEQGFTISDAGKMAAGWAHCPQAPEHLGTITRPAGIGEDQTQFKELIAERQQFALAPHGRTGSGRRRGVCPALDGKIGCPLVQGSVEAAVEAGLPTVPMPEAPLATVCSNASKTVTFPAGADGRHEKLDQPYYWGSPEWVQSYNRRSRVESLFGNLKNPNAEGIKDSFNQVSGIARNSLFIGVAAAAYNLRLRLKHDDSGPFAVEGEKLHHIACRSPEEADAVAELLAQLRAS